MSMQRVVEVLPLDNYRIRVQFADNYQAEIDIKPFIRGGISDTLKVEAYFRSVKIDEMGGIYWDNGFDFCPNYLRQLAEGEIKKVA